MCDFNSLELSYKEYDGSHTFYETNGSLSYESNEESENSDNRRNVSDTLNKDRNNKVEKYIKLENTLKIWAGTNKVINFKKKDDHELNKTIYNYNNKEIHVSNNISVLNLNNNNLENINFLDDILIHTYKHKNLELDILYLNIITLDISFNKLEDINDSILNLHNLKVLYLHSNKIQNIVQVKKLQALLKLKKFTIENNPIMDIYNKFYRHFIIHYLPQIKSLDFHDISKIEKNKSDITFNTHKYKFNLE
ncbi:leucine-rich repeat protein [Plasmodium sp. gorilla clade G2]|uniref:leucine-rich repeat protein n=1 Tax=Plasmodium sp. gorilla clade G2 TaxID=880535 RepID=UPI000D1FFE31|nr:leucine-rich repeat protein [Plasmodium sp. gorilla clade G2]SOV19858.1 leucine-rich repeat protein [Plasmodium sp. gorilla clade G2]